MEEVHDGSFPPANLPVRARFFSFSGGREIDSRSRTVSAPGSIVNPKRRRQFILEIEDDKSAIRLAFKPDRSRLLISSSFAKDLTIILSA
uniref:Uncharacterized protein n=1 Tax=Arundo donax TaxID=35708 RepID=A0A0A9BJD6_ARUDO